LYPLLLADRRTASQRRRWLRDAKLPLVGTFRGSVHLDFQVILAAQQEAFFMYRLTSEVVMAPTTDQAHDFIRRALCGLELFS
jgi:hypothetical protein